MLDREKAEVYELLVHLGCRVCLAAVFTASFIVVLGFLLYNPNKYLAIVEAILGPTTFVVVKFFFPSAAKAKARAQKAKK